MYVCMYGQVLVGLGISRGQVLYRSLEEKKKKRKCLVWYGRMPAVGTGDAGQADASDG